MLTLWWSVAVALLACIAGGLAFVYRRRGGADSLLAVLLFGTTGTALALVLGEANGIPRAVDVALVLALLAAILGVTFVRRGWPRDPGHAGDGA